MLAELSRNATVGNGAQNAKWNKCRRLCPLHFFFFFFEIRVTPLSNETELGQNHSK